jgi:1-deoxy-D-xylulose-5-phosphate reductoisomerase
VTFADGAVTAGLAQPDMRVPIAHCLGFPDRVGTRARRLDLAEIGSLTFERPDFDRFPALRVALEALAAGNGLPTVLNAANEVAVAAYLAGECGFRDIPRCAEQVCAEFTRSGEAREPQSIAEALELDRIARARARAVLN